MNKTESYALFKSGQCKWNEWASNISKDCPVGGTESSAWKDWEARAVANFQGVTFSELVDFSGFEFPAEVSFKGAKFKSGVFFEHAKFHGIVSFDESQFGNEAPESLAKVSFKGANFKGDALFRKTNFLCASWFFYSDFESRVDFSEAIFHQDARFYRLKFNQHVSFSRATFKKIAQFWKIRLEDESSFTKASFHGLTWFISSAFKGNTSFSSSTFHGNADFRQCTFENGATFANIDCKSDVDFSGIQSRSLFQLNHAKFLSVPEFDQANFMEPPRLHRIQIKLNHGRSVLQFIKKFWKGEQGQEARWRTLKRLALQAHDYIREQEFHANEIRMRRGTTDQFWKVSYLFGILYELFSNFGQSIARPLCLWAFGIILSAVGYRNLYYYQATGKFWQFSWLETPIEIWTAALGLALHRGLPAVSGLGNRLPDYHSVLYNVGSRYGQASLSPSFEALLGQVQVLFSTAMIFLFLLALRNRFRMK